MIRSERRIPLLKILSPKVFLFSRRSKKKQTVVTPPQCNIDTKIWFLGVSTGHVKVVPDYQRYSR